MSEEDQRKAVVAVILSQTLVRRERELQELKGKGITDPQKELVVKRLREALLGP